MRVVLDLDGVCYNFVDTANFLLNQKFGVTLGPWTTWDHGKRFLTEEQHDWLWSQEPIDQGLYRYGHLYKGTKVAVDRMAQDHEVAIVTSRPREAVADTMDWLAFHRFATQEVHILRPGEPKTRIKGDVYIDDALHVMEEVLAHSDAKFVLVDHPWNRWVEYSPYAGPNPRWSRALDWADVFIALEEAR